MTAARELSDAECEQLMYDAWQTVGYYKMRVAMPKEYAAVRAAYAAGRESMRKDVMEVISRLHIVPHSVILCCDTIDVAGAALDALP